ncbi:hypothetical protein HYDPIDRAFT_115789 [Hydnomerulius pinastri MD-312]|uniref:Uncharacterized protein n=1 Tax=Hydnomerulius pinastri MD-312 TaxID=994086 RepID=A0A0C9WCG5_9AGAM|nr:hypothetical protein HYDPIDRAFT_115789 [Hydnomerulius pinastri MD-312]
MSGPAVFLVVNGVAYDNFQLIRSKYPCTDLGNDSESYTYYNASDASTSSSHHSSQSSHVSTPQQDISRGVQSTNLTSARSDAPGKRSRTRSGMLSWLKGVFGGSRERRQKLVQQHPVQIQISPPKPLGQSGRAAHSSRAPIPTPITKSHRIRHQNSVSLPPEYHQTSYPSQRPVPQHQMYHQPATHQPTVYQPQVYHHPAPASLQGHHSTQRRASRHHGSAQTYYMRQ